MIYKDDFIELLREKLGAYKEITKNIITKCPWCEYNDNNKKHYHLYVVKSFPYFRCFRCNKSGDISILLNKLNGFSKSEDYIFESKVQEFKKNKKKNEVEKSISIILPNINEDRFSNKSKYFRNRFIDHEINFNNLDDIIFDVKEFFYLNKLHNSLNPDFLEYLHQNFIGFLTTNKSEIILRNIDSYSDFRYFKHKIFETCFLDYYKIKNNKKNNNVILAEGTFDVLSEYFFDFTKNKHNTNFYATALSNDYSSLLKSICLNENIFKIKAVILSDNNIHINYYKKLKRENSFLFDSLTVYYNKNGKDFNTLPVMPEKFVI